MNVSTRQIFYILLHMAGIGNIHYIFNTVQVLCHTSCFDQYIPKFLLTEAIDIYGPGISPV